MLLFLEGLIPSIFKIKSDERVSIQTKGKVKEDRRFIKGATRIEIPSGFDRPIRLGTSSPNTKEQYVMLNKTMATAKPSAKGLIGSNCESQPSRSLVIFSPL